MIASGKEEERAAGNQQRKREAARGRKSCECTEVNRRETETFQSRPGWFITRFCPKRHRLRRSKTYEFFFCVCALRAWFPCANVF